MKVTKYKSCKECRFKRSGEFADYCMLYNSKDVPYSGPPPEFCPLREGISYSLMTEEEIKEEEKREQEKRDREQKDKDWKIFKSLAEKYGW